LVEKEVSSIQKLIKIENKLLKISPDFDRKFPDFMKGDTERILTVKETKLEIMK